MYVKKLAHFDHGTVEHQTEIRNTKEIYNLVKEMENCIFVLEAEPKFLVIHEFLSREKFIKWLKTKLIL